MSGQLRPHVTFIEVALRVLPGSRPCSVSCALDWWSTETSTTASPSTSKRKNDVTRTAAAATPTSHNHPTPGIPESRYP